MSNHTHASHRARQQTASQLAEMGYCERKVLLRHLHGDRVTPARSAARTRGVAEHRRFFTQAVKDDLKVEVDARPHSLCSVPRVAGFFRQIFAQMAAPLSRFRKGRS